MVKDSKPRAVGISRRDVLQGLAMGLLASGAHAQSSALVMLATATPGGSFKIYGEAFARIINDSAAGLMVEPRNTKGSLENIPLLESGKLDIALVAGEPAFEALSGVKRPVANLRIVTAMYSTPGMFAVRGDSTYKAIADLKGKPIAFGARGSGLPILANYVLDGMGLDLERDFQPVFLGKAGDGPVLLREGKVAAAWGGGTGWPGFVTITKEGGRFIAPSPDDIARIRARHGYLPDMSLPANSYSGQTEAIRSVGSWSFILARPTLDDDVAYRLTRALHRNEQAFAKLLPQASEPTAENTVRAAFLTELLHPGTRKYLQEISLI